MYEYMAVIKKVVDGDTVHARVDLGMDVRIDVTLRLLGINAPEHGTPEGAAATAFLRDEILGITDALDWPTVRIFTIKDKREKYGRYLARIWLEHDLIDLPSVNKRMLDAGHAKPYDGRGPKP